MSIQTTDARHVALFDSVTGIAFGPVFDDVPEADAFVRWYESKAHTMQTTALPRDVRLLIYQHAATVKYVADKWRAFLAEHPEDACPWDIDHDSYGIGYTGDSDKSHGDYITATPDSCDCECHRQPGGVHTPEGRNR